MSEKPEINYKEFYEIDGKRLNIWQMKKNSYVYSREYVRYTRLAGHFKGSSLEVLDLGCGDGYLSCMLARKGHKIDAMDISEARLKKFEAQAKELGIRQINGSVYEYSFDKKYDVIIISEVIEHLENYMDILKKACSILKSGGRLVIGVPYREKIRFCRCPYCLKEFNEYGHINSFDETVFSSISKELNCRISSIETFCSKYVDFLFRLIPFKSYKLYICGDKFFSWAARNKNSQMIVSIVKND